MILNCSRGKTCSLLLNPEALFPITWIGHASTSSVQPGDFFFPIRGCGLCSCERIDWARLFITLLCCTATGREPLVQSVKYTKMFNPFGNTYEDRHAPCSPPSILKAAPVIQTSNNNPEIDPESSPERNRHQTLLISAVAEQDWAGMSYAHYLLFCENHLHNTTLTFIVHQTSF